MNFESFPFIKQPLRCNQVVFSTIKIIYNEMNKSAGNPAATYLLTVRLISMSKLEAIFLPPCNSPIIALGLYLTGIFDVHCTGSFFILLYTWVVILLLLSVYQGIWSDPILRSISYFGSTSSTHCKVHQFHYFFSDIGIIQVVLVEKRFWRCHYILFHLANINIRMNNRYWSFHWAASNLFY